MIVHQARLMQLRTVSESLQEVLTCETLERGSDALVEQLLGLSGRVTSGLQSLVAYRDSQSSYDRLCTRLRAWLQKAEGKMDALALQPLSHPYDFWVSNKTSFCRIFPFPRVCIYDIKIPCFHCLWRQELKAQLETLQPLRNEASVLLDQCMRALHVTDEPTIRGVFANFDDRWCSLVAAVASTELSSFYGEPDTESSVSTRLGVMSDELSTMASELSTMLVNVDSEDDLYVYLEKLQVRTYAQLECDC